MPILKYMGWVGASLFALLLLANWYLPRPVTEPAGDTVNRPVIRITSLQQPPEQVFIDTSLPTIAPPPMLFGDTVPSQTSPRCNRTPLWALTIIERETLRPTTKPQ